MTKWTVITKTLKSRLALWSYLAIVCAVLFQFFIFPYPYPLLWYIAYSIAWIFATMMIFEAILSVGKKRKFKIYGGRKKPKVFEFGFFLTIFVATISASIIIAIEIQSLFNVTALNIQTKLELIKQYLWFTGLYGVAIAFGIYHYIFHEDE